MRKLIVILSLFLLAACSPAPAPALDRPTPATAAPSATRTRVPPTPTKAATVQPTSTKPVPAATQTPVPTASPTGVAGACPVHENAWHAPQDVPCMHHVHGDNPRDPEIVALFAGYGFDLNAWLDEHGELWQPAWTSSPLEAIDHAAGFSWHLNPNPNCDQFSSQNTDFSDQACIIWSLVRIHDDGGAVHFVSRFHSLSSVRIVCGKNAAGDWTGNISPSNCDVVATGMLGDSGEAHTPYKNFWCRITDTDADLLDGDNPPDLKNGGLYRANQNQDDRGMLFQAWWFQPANAVDKYLYPHDPQAGWAVTWISQTWQVWDQKICDQTLAEMKTDAANLPIGANGGHNLFQFFNERVLFQVKVPFEGFTDRWGHIITDDSCTTPSLSCIPLYIGPNYPVGDNGLSQPALLQRRFEDGDCVFAPCLVYETNGVELLPPWLDVP